MGFNEQYNEMRHKTDEELLRYLADQNTHSATRVMADTELRKRETDRHLKATRDLVKSTRRLVYATWAVAGATAILVAINI